MNVILLYSNERYVSVTYVSFSGDENIKTNKIIMCPNHFIVKNHTFAKNSQFK